MISYPSTLKGIKAAAWTGFMKEDRYLSELSKCVRCGSCKALCPTYEEISTEAVGARGRLALLWGLAAGHITSSETLNDRIFSCTLCGACSGLCPPGVDIKGVFYQGRRILKETDTRRNFLRFLAKFCTKRPEMSFKALRIVQHILFPYLYKRKLVPFKPELPEYFLTESRQVYTVSKKRGRVAIFAGCTVNYLYPHLGEALISVLHKLGYEVVLPAGEVCCGMPLRGLGLEEEARRLAKKNFGILSKLNVEAVLSLCPSCTVALKKEYPGFIGEGIENAADISSFFLDKMDFSRFRHLISPEKKAIYHDPCHLRYGLGIEKEPREIIKNIGIELIKTREKRCCGFAGVFCLSNKDISQALLNKCLNNYMSSGAGMIVTSCPGCIIQLSREINDKPVLHLIEVIEEALLQNS
jgi:glycolate oxidase iron-sulfur subunit